MRLETVKSGFTGDEGLEKHLVRVYFGDLFETTFSVTHDEHTGRLWISYIPGMIEVEVVQMPKREPFIADRGSGMTTGWPTRSSAPTARNKE